MLSGRCVCFAIFHFDELNSVLRILKFADRNFVISLLKNHYWWEYTHVRICVYIQRYVSELSFFFHRMPNDLISFFVTPLSLLICILPIPFGCLFSLVLFRSAVSLLSPLHWQNRINIFYVTNLKLNAAWISHWLACVNDATHMQPACKVQLELRLQVQMFE